MSHGLTLSGPGRARPSRSLRQQYQEFLLQRIEEYKDGLTREELLRIGDEAIGELEHSAADQYLLTEVLLLEHVDRIIMRRLKLPSYRRWRAKYVALREAQRQPTHWGLDPDTALVAHARRLPADASALVVGAARSDVALYLAAHDIRVVLIDQDLSTVERAENRAATEQLAAQLEAFVVSFGGWLPPCRPRLVVVEPRIFDGVPLRTVETLLFDLKTATPTGGTHVVLPEREQAGAVERLQAHYPDWVIGRFARTSRRPSGFTATCPPCPNDTDDVSD